MPTPEELANMSSKDKESMKLNSSEMSKMNQEELVEVRDLVKRISVLSGEQKKALSIYLETGKSPASVDERISVEKPQASLIQPTERIKSIEDLESQYPNAGFDFQEGYKPGQIVLDRVSNALNEVSRQIGEEKFKRLKIAFSDFSPIVKVRQDGTINMGIVMSDEEMTNQMVENAKVALSRIEALESEGQTRTSLWTSVNKFAESFKSLGVRVELGEVKDLKKFEGNLEKLGQILNVIKDIEGEHRIIANFVINDSGGSHSEGIKLAVDLSEDSESIRQAILKFTKYNSPRKK